jgi:hypothetical protein
MTRGLDREQLRQHCGSVRDRVTSSTTQEVPIREVRTAARWCDGDHRQRIYSGIPTRCRWQSRRESPQQTGARRRKLRHTSFVLVRASVIHYTLIVEFVYVRVAAELD